MRATRGMGGEHGTAFAAPGLPRMIGVGEWMAVYFAQPFTPPLRRRRAACTTLRFPARCTAAGATIHTSQSGAAWESRDLRDGRSGARGDVRDHVVRSQRGVGWVWLVASGCGRSESGTEGRAKCDRQRQERSQADAPPPLPLRRGKRE